ncbi:MAG: hypothetical protein SOT09_05360 [Candidatus Borkfalkiaceae bacterium]|nr:hypothetical protein [Christensenellaceae bacterium]
MEYDFFDVNKFYNLSLCKNGDISFAQDNDVRGRSDIIISNANGCNEVISSTNMINCIDCGHYVSVHADRCVMCGCTLSHTLKIYYNVLFDKINTEKEIKEQELFFARKNLFRCLSKVLLKKLSEEIPSAVKDLLKEAGIDISQCSYDEIFKLHKKCKDTPVKNLMEKEEEAVKNLFFEIVKRLINKKRISPNDVYKTSDDDLYLSYVRFLVVKEEGLYFNRNITSGNSREPAKLADFNLIKKIAYKISEDIKTLQKESFLIFDDFKYEELYVKYIKILQLTNYGARKRDLRRFCIYNMVYPLLAEYGKDIRNILKVPTKYVFEISLANEKTICKNDIIIASNKTKYDLRNDEAEEIIAKLEYIEENSHITKSTELNTLYCKNSNKYYFDEKELPRLLKLGKLQCKLFTEETFSNKSTALSEQAAQSLLNKCGYNVQSGSSQELSADERRLILDGVIRNEVYPYEELKKFLQWLIYVRKNRKDMSRAISKWQEDIEYLENNRQRLKSY